MYIYQLYQQTYNKYKYRWYRPLNFNFPAAIFNDLHKALSTHSEIPVASQGVLTIEGPKWMNINFRSINV